jgi:hypothetical protein
MYVNDPARIREWQVRGATDAILRDERALREAAEVEARRRLGIESPLSAHRHRLIDQR